MRSATLIQLLTEGAQTLFTGLLKASVVDLAHAVHPSQNLWEILRVLFSSPFPY